MVEDADNAAPEQAPHPEAATTANAPTPTAPLVTTVGCKWLDVPEIQPFVGESGVAYINDPERSYPDGQKLILKRRVKGGGRLEVKTTISPGVTEAQKGEHATYISQEDCRNFGAGSQAPQVRKYRLLDSLCKLWSWGGALIAVPAIAGALGAWATVWGVLMPSPTDLNADRIQAVLSWAAEPLATLPTPSNPVAEGAAATEFENRSIRATACVQSLQGHHGPVPQIPQITCVPASKSWVQRHGAQVAAIATGLVTIAGLLTALRRTRFREKP